EQVSRRLTELAAVRFPTVLGANDSLLGCKTTLRYRIRHKTPSYDQILVKKTQTSAFNYPHQLHHQDAPSFNSSYQAADKVDNKTERANTTGVQQDSLSNIIWGGLDFLTSWFPHWRLGVQNDSATKRSPVMCAFCGKVSTAQTFYHLLNGSMTDFQTVLESTTLSELLKLFAVKLSYIFQEQKFRSPTHAQPLPTKVSLIFNYETPAEAAG
ncbi:hypothetical protein T265_15463, partial [Opisthorchis viverrini]